MAGESEREREIQVEKLIYKKIILFFFFLFLFFTVQIFTKYVVVTRYQKTRENEK